MRLRGFCRDVSSGNVTEMTETNEEPINRIQSIQIHCSMGFSSYVLEKIVGFCTWIRLSVRLSALNIHPTSSAPIQVAVY